MVSAAAIAQQGGWRAELRTMAPKFVATMGTSGMIAVLALISGMIAARELGPSSRGLLAQLLLWPQLFCTVGNLGVDVATTYFTADRGRARNAPASAFTIAIAQTIVLAPLYLALVPLLYDTRAHRIDAMLMAPLIPAYLLGAYAASSLMGHLRLGSFNIIRVAMPLLYCTGIVAVAASGHLTPRSGALAFLAAHVAVDVLAILLALRVAGAGKVDIMLIRSMLSYGVRAQGGRLSPQALGVDTLVIALFLAPHDLGLFVAATAILTAPQLLMSSMTIVVFPHVSASHQAGERPRMQATFVAYAAAAIAIAAALWFLAAPAIGLMFGSSFADAAPVLRVLAIAGVARAVRQFPLEVLRGIGRPGLTSIAEGANWTFFLVAVPAGAALGGLHGAAMGVAVANFASLGALLALTMLSGVGVRAFGRAPALEAAS